MSIAIVCESCERSLKVGDHLAGRKIKCPGCGKVLAVPAEEIEEPQEVADPEPAARRDRRDRDEEPKKKRTGRKGAALESGKTIHRAFKLGDVLFFLGFLGISVGLFVLGIFSEWAAIAGKGKNALETIGLVVVGLICLAAGGSLSFVAGKGGWRHLRNHWKKERFIIGKDKLQWVLGDGELLGQVPYDNIEELCLRNLESPNGDPYQIIGVRFRDGKRRDTFIDDDFRRADWEEEGLDFAIWDIYDTPLKAFFKSLKKARNQAGDESE